MAKTQKIGLWTSTSLVVGNMIGAGVFLMPAAMATFGSVSLLGWVFSAIGSFFLAKVFSNLSRMLPNSTGGPYAYARHGLGDFAGFLVAWGYYLATACANAAITVSFVSSLSAFFPILATNMLAAIITGLSAIWLLIWINTRGVAVSGSVQLITTILKLAPLLIISIGGLFFIKSTNFHPFNNSNTSLFGAVTATAAMTMFSFVGIESATIPAGNIQDSKNTIAKATLLGLLIATLVYILGTVSVMGIIPANILQHSVTPFADTAVVMFGPSAKYWVSAGVAIAAFGALNGWTLLQGEMPFAIAKDGLFPGIFRKQNSKGMPYIGMAISGVIVSLFMAMNYTKALVDQFRFLLLLSVFTMMVAYLFSVIAYAIISLKSSNMNGKRASAIVLAVLAFVYILWEVAGAGPNSVFSGFILLMAGVPLYAWSVWKRNEKQESGHP